VSVVRSGSSLSAVLAMSVRVEHVATQASFTGGTPQVLLVVLGEAHHEVWVDAVHGCSFAVDGLVRWLEITGNSRRARRPGARIDADARSERRRRDGARSRASRYAVAGAAPAGSKHAGAVARSMIVSIVMVGTSFVRRVFCRTVTIMNDGARAKQSN
jgi:hypothetical protein